MKANRKSEHYKKKRKQKFISLMYTLIPTENTENVLYCNLFALAIKKCHAILSTGF